MSASNSTTDINPYRADFPILQRPGVYLNHAAMGPWARPTALAVQQFAQENLEQGAAHYVRWMQIENQVHHQLAQLLNAEHVDDIALCKNTSEGLSLIANGIEWNAGDEVVIPDIEFPSNRLPWLAQAPHGVSVHEVSLSGNETSEPSPEQALMAACNNNTRLMSVSAVQYGNGLRLDIATLGAFCRANNILFCVDAIQQLGALPLDVQSSACDFVVADAHKWLLGPEGIAVFYSTAKARAQLRDQQQGWRMYEQPFNFDRSDWSTPKSARRFEPGSPNMVGIFALQASLKLLLDIGVETIAQRILSHSQKLSQGIAQMSQLSLLSATEIERSSGIVSFTTGHAESDAELQKALKTQGILGAHRGGGIRWSPHFYQSSLDMEKALLELARCLAPSDPGTQ
ncbi:MAG: aminotransferase class V-fold PLP-dependent enzyme [Xanthomonadales bacterium]|nr:aminotransferase class V-fold PLP-dependent enzyme [Xanthomonadales bacterium]